MTNIPVPPKPGAPRPPDGIPGLQADGIITVRPTFGTGSFVPRNTEDHSEGGWWVVRHAVDDRIVTSYRAREDAEEHADRAAILYGRRVFVTHSAELP